LQADFGPQQRPAAGRCVLVGAGEVCITRLAGQSLQQEGVTVTGVTCPSTIIVKTDSPDTNAR
jgi:hypothetical protein